MNPTRLIGPILPALLLVPMAGGSAAEPEKNRPRVTVKRCSNNPLITFKTSKSLGDNINGPSVIRVPKWVKNPLGKYYMYFAHHSGRFIRLAYANQLSGPWKIYEPGVLYSDQVKVIKGHIASPDVHIDHDKKQIRMYVHGPLVERKGQKTSMARSKDGLSFQSDNAILGKAYFRVFEWNRCFYAFDGGSRVYRSKFPDKDWVMSERQVLPPITITDKHGTREDAGIRHPSVLLRGDTMYVFYSRKGHAPERILMSTVKLTDDWTKWKASEPVEVIQPEAEYEGIEYPLQPSKGGKGINLRELRDPYVFEEDGKCYLFYTFGGEMGIAMAEITIEDRRQ